MSTLENSVDPDEMQHNAAFHQGLHCLLRSKEPSGTEMHHEQGKFDEYISPDEGLFERNM